MSVDEDHHGLISQGKVYCTSGLQSSLSVPVSWKLQYCPVLAKFPAPCPLPGVRLSDCRNHYCPKAIWILALDSMMLKFTTPVDTTKSIAGHYQRWKAGPLALVQLLLPLPRPTFHALGHPWLLQEYANPRQVTGKKSCVLAKAT